MQVQFSALIYSPNQCRRPDALVFPHITGLCTVHGFHFTAVGVIRYIYICVAQAEYCRTEKTQGNSTLHSWPAQCIICPIWWYFTALHITNFALRAIKVFLFYPYSFQFPCFPILFPISFLQCGLCGQFLKIGTSAVLLCFLLLNICLCLCLHLRWLFCLLFNFFGIGTGALRPLCTFVSCYHQKLARKIFACANAFL